MTTTTTTTALNVWWFGGTSLEQSTLQQTEDDSCELVPVRIERPSSNSRKILGEIVVPVPLEDVWAILTDYDHLATHVPNLVESRIVGSSSGSSSNSGSGSGSGSSSNSGSHNNNNNNNNNNQLSQPGDGRHQCRLYQKGAQKIVGFEFGASVTMDMKEIAYDLQQQQQQSQYQSPALSYATNGNNVIPLARTGGQPPRSSSLRERRILFKCVDSFFFNQFDGEWKVVEQPVGSGESTNYHGNGADDNEPAVETVLSYVVDVKPKGPVPVVALEWRIREDVPTNLRAVKKAALEVGRNIYQQQRQQQQLQQQRQQQRQQQQQYQQAQLVSSATVGRRNVWNRQPQQQKPSLQPLAQSRQLSPEPQSLQQQQQQQQQRATRRRQAAQRRTTTQQRRMQRVRVQWDDSETMAAYLEETPPAAAQSQRPS